MEQEKERSIQSCWGKEHQILMTSDLKLSPVGQHDEIIARGNNQYLTDEKWLRESNIRERNAMQQNKNFVCKLSLTGAQPKVPLE
jgi:hypothetical protein